MRRLIQNLYGFVVVAALVLFMGAGVVNTERAQHRLEVCDALMRGSALSTPFGPFIISQDMFDRAVQACIDEDTYAKYRDMFWSNSNGLSTGVGVIASTTQRNKSVSV